MPATTLTFKQETPFDKRCHLSQKILQSYHDRVPVIVEKSPNSDIPDIQRKKFLAPAEINISKFQMEIRKHIAIPPEKTIFLYVGNNVLPQQSATMAQIYNQYRDEDGFLYVVYSGESVFGAE